MSFFATISTDSKSASNYAYFDAHVEFLFNFVCSYEHFLLTQKSNTDEKSGQCALFQKTQQQWLPHPSPHVFFRLLAKLKSSEYFSIFKYLSKYAFATVFCLSYKHSLCIPQFCFRVQSKRCFVTITVPNDPA